MITVALILLGLCMGSFTNAFVWRVHEKKNFLNDRSECVHCHHKLSAMDLIPIVSWTLLRGKCRYCHQAISPQYPLVEACVASLFVISYVFWPLKLNGYEIAVFALWLAIATGLVALAVYDLRWMILPTKIIYALLILALALAIISILNSGTRFTMTLDYILSFLIGGGIFYLIYILSKGKWIGGGDVRLGFLLGLLAAAPARSFMLIFIASLIGTAISIPLVGMSRLKRSSLIPFGPLLILALFIVQFAGQDIIHWYSQVFLGNLGLLL